jgi:hypothetical protein
MTTLELLRLYLKIIASEPTTRLYLRGMLVSLVPLGDGVTIAYGQTTGSSLTPLGLIKTSAASSTRSDGQT